MLRQRSVARNPSFNLRYCDFLMYLPILANVPTLHPLKTPEDTFGLPVF